MRTVAIYHDAESRFGPYQDGQPLAAATSHRVDADSDRSAEAVAEWAFRIFNADLDTLEAERDSPAVEAAFLAACVYRLLGHRSLSVGDVVHVHDGPDGIDGPWLACDSHGWRSISPPSNVAGQPLTAEKVYQHLAEQRDRT